MSNEIEYSDKSPTTTLYLSVVFGWFGLHRIYVGKILTGLLMLFCTIGMIVLLIFFVILEESGVDKEGIILLGIVIFFIVFSGSIVWYVLDICRIFQKRFKDKKGRVIDLSRPLPEVMLIKSDKSAATMFLLFQGFYPVEIFGLYRLYIDKTWTGLLMLFFSFSALFGEKILNFSQMTLDSSRDYTSIQVGYISLVFLVSFWVVVWSTIDLIYMLNNKLVDGKGRAIEFIKSVSDDSGQSSKSPVGTYILARYCGFFGVHRFYVGKIFQGILTVMLLFVPISLIMSDVLSECLNIMLFCFSLVVLSLWWGFDEAIILSNKFKDVNGNKILLVKDPVSFSKNMFFILPSIFLSIAVFLEVFMDLVVG